MQINYRRTCQALVIASCLLSSFRQQEGVHCALLQTYTEPKIEPSDIIHSVPWVSCSGKSCAQTFNLFGEGASKKWIQIIWPEEKDIENSHIVKRKPISSQSFPFEYPIGISYGQALENCLIKRDSVLIEVTKSKERISFSVTALELKKNVRKFSFSFAK